MYQENSDRRVRIAQQLTPESEKTKKKEKEIGYVIKPKGGQSQNVRISATPLGQRDHKNEVVDASKRSFYP
jgi:hypothetical protein